MAVDQIGNILYQGHSGAANLATTPEARLRRNLQHASIGCPPARFVCGCFAGLVNEQIRLRGLALLREVFPQAQVRAEPDYTAAFYASPPGTDLCVISGTGSLVCSRIDVQIVKSGGRGFILGDEGSSYKFGRDAVAHYLRDPRSVSERLREAILEGFGTLDPGDITAAVYRSGTPATVLAKFARSLGQDAQAAEQYALDSLNFNLGELAQTLKQHLNQFHPGLKSKVNLSLSGGLWKASPIFRERFHTILTNTIDIEEISMVRIARPPLHGAVELAREMIIVN